MFRSMIIAFSMYSKIPMPRVEWNEKSMRYSMCFFPLVGAVIGLCEVACFYLLQALSMSNAAKGAILAALPVLINGGIHMDGFLDTIDAKHSWKPAEEKLKILKDPHTGAFAIIYGILYFLLSFGLFCEVGEKQIGWVAAGFVLSRTLSGLSIVTFRKAKKDGTAAAFADAAQKNVRWILLAELILWAAALLWMDPVKGAVCMLAALAAFGYYRHMAYKFFGGITGDLAGYFLQICELMLLLAVVVTGKFLG